jgi:hypothetical protein
MASGDDETVRASSVELVISTRDCDINDAGDGSSSASPTVNYIHIFKLFDKKRASMRILSVQYCMQLSVRGTLRMQPRRSLERVSCIKLLPCVLAVLMCLRKDLSQKCIVPSIRSRAEINHLVSNRPYSGSSVIRLKLNVHAYCMGQHNHCSIFCIDDIQGIQGVPPRDLLIYCLLL